MVEQENKFCQECDHEYEEGANFQTIMAHIKKVHMTDEIEADYEISLEKDNREPYL